MGKEIICDLQKIPGVGKNIEEDLLNIGIRRIEDLKGKSGRIVSKGLYL